jgi:hypothetical protein
MNPQNQNNLTNSFSGVFLPQNQAQPQLGYGNQMGQMNPGQNPFLAKLFAKENTFSC